MNETKQIQILPYTKIIGQDELKLALELSFISPRIGGVLISGQRGTGKSTAVRAFAMMMYGSLPVTLPINATEDRVVGGWKIDELMRGQPVEKPGLLEEANGSMLYVDEINLLDDHIVNIILDVTATGVLVIQREARDDTRDVKFLLVGTMNPEEGELRPQLLDRFGLMVNVHGELDQNKRKRILNNVLALDEALSLADDASKGANHPFIISGTTGDQKLREKLVKAKSVLYKVHIPDSVVEFCVDISKAFDVIGHRGDYVMALAARALAARDGNSQVTVKHVQAVARLALEHRRSSQEAWSDAEDKRIMELVNHALG